MSSYTLHFWLRAAASARGIDDAPAGILDCRRHDGAVAQNAGAGSVLVLSGETDQAMVDAAERKPDLVLPSVKELHELLRG